MPSTRDNCDDPHLAAAPLDLASYLAGLSPHAGAEPLCAAELATPLGMMIAVADAACLHLLEFADRKALPASLARLARQAPLRIGRNRLIDELALWLARYFNAEPVFAPKAPPVPLSAQGTPFQHEVWRGLQAIPAGARRSYGDFAAGIGHPEAVRAVAAANAANRIAILIPCHRLVARGGALTGYGGGIWRKQHLLALEARAAASKCGESA
ncbi:methylated-DNA--[protein]-cysteine S-methyltransferase [Paracoccus aminophilus]|uniref:methylated-DNA--[protein]-cysteine S-methyltransferase n=1 Tax=Paracoccus aminophilus JCM 7686 TaxID=1367847 RepID=S5YE23_PARAH|nr:methylated-DNA--[protein]-cysteine S-methyltransferase [Paracoccus aminophilus]AGT09733.1 methylated-DNA-(protein)-cysteine S-methyltransferase [Paracoccus aminophilus JCM 7686]